MAPPSINLRLSAIRKLAAEVAENGLLDRSVTQGIVSLKGVHQSGDATVQHRGAVQDKPIQGQLRHAKAEITRNVYMPQVDPRTYEAVVNLEKLMNRNGGSKQDV